MTIHNEEIRDKVKDRYGNIARIRGGKGCCEIEENCCSSETDSGSSTRLGYSVEELESLPSGADMGLGSGNPVPHAQLQKGEVVLDLGSGGGIDCFLAAQEVGSEGKVIEVDMTPQMVELARKNAEEGGFENVEIVKGEIENIPISNNSVDVVLSNCVINLSTDQRLVYSEIYRVLKTGGRMAVSDKVASAEVPEQIRNSPDLLCGCVGGAAPMGEVKKWLSNMGFNRITIEPDMETRTNFDQWVPGTEGYVVSAMIKAMKNGS